MPSRQATPSRRSTRRRTDWVSVLLVVVGVIALVLVATGVAKGSNPLLLLLPITLIVSAGSLVRKSRR